MIFKDINCGFYPYRKQGLYAGTISEIEEVMAANGITAAALCNCDRANGSVRQLNDLTLQHSRSAPETLTPVIRLLPPAYPQESYTRDEMYGLIEKDQAIFRISPQQDACPLVDWMFGWMLDILCETSTPLLVSLQELDLKEAASVKEKYPALRLVITNTTQWLNRQYIRFALNFPDVYLDTSNIIEYYGLENIVRLLGARRVLFGTYMPEKEPYDKIFQLIFSDLSEEQKSLIAYGNYDRLVGRERI